MTKLTPGKTVMHVQKARILQPKIETPSMAINAGTIFCNQPVNCTQCEEIKDFSGIECFREKREVKLLLTSDKFILFPC